MTIDELRRLEQPELAKLIDEGKLMYSPCAVGDTVYVYAVAMSDTHILRTIIKPDICTAIHFVNSKMYVQTKDYDWEQAWRILGVDTFLTLEQAEQALKEMEGEKNDT